jgi:hypothetical protein
MNNYINLIQEIISAVESNYSLYLYRGQNRLEVLMSEELFSDFHESVARDCFLKDSDDKKHCESTVAGMRLRVSEKLRGCVWAIALCAYGTSSQIEHVSSYCEPEESCLKNKRDQRLLSACNDVVSFVETAGWLTKDSHAFDVLKLELKNNNTAQKDL